MDAAIDDAALDAFGAVLLDWKADEGGLTTTCTVDILRAPRASSTRSLRKAQRACSRSVRKLSPARAAMEEFRRDGPRQPVPGLEAMPARAFDFGPPLPGWAANGLGRHWDGVFYVRTVAPVAMVR